MWRDRIKMMARIGPWVHADVPQYFLPDLPHRMASGAENFAQVLVSYEISNPHAPLPFILDAGRWEWITPPQRSFLVPFFFLEREGDFERATTATMDVKQMKWADPPNQVRDCPLVSMQGVSVRTHGKIIFPSPCLNRFDGGASVPLWTHLASARMRRRPAYHASSQGWKIRRRRHWKDSGEKGPRVRQNRLAHE